MKHLLVLTGKEEEEVSWKVTTVHPDVGMFPQRNAARECAGDPCFDTAVVMKCTNV